MSIYILSLLYVLIAFYSLYYRKMKQETLKKNLIAKLSELKENLGYSYDDDVKEIQSLCIDYQNETGDCSLENAFDEFISEEIAEEYVKDQLASWWLARIPFLCGDVDFLHYDYFRLNGYWNLENIDRLDVECLIDDLLYRLNN